MKGNLGGTEVKEYRLAKMTWPEIKEGIGKVDAILLPVGATEQHGRHLPIDLDFFMATQLCEMAAMAANKKQKWVLVTPAIVYACSWYHMHFAGTITLSQRTFMEVVKETCDSLASHGFRNLIIMNAHGGNSAALTTCLTDLYAEKRIRVCLAQWWSLMGTAAKELGIVSPLVHAEEIETAIAMALGVDVRMHELSRDGFDRAMIHKQKGIPTSRHIAYDMISPGSGVIIPKDFIHEVSTSGVVGDATLATKENGEKLVASIINGLVELVEDLAK